MNYIKQILTHHRTLWVLLAVLICGSLIRVYRLDSLPSILNRDEAALGYNAWLLTQTGVDEWHQPWPLMLRSFGDYKLVGYVNLAAVSQLMFGQTDWAVRLPSAAAGVILILIGWWWGQHWKQGWFMALLVTVTPVFWFYSRVAFEANLALTLFTAGLGALIFPKKNQLSWSAIGVGLIWWSTLVYNTPLLLVPFILPLFPLVWGLKNWRQWWGPAAALVLIFVSMMSQLWPLTQQKSSITLFSDAKTWTEYTEYRATWSGLSQKIWGSKYVYFMGQVGVNAANSVLPQFMVTQGGSHPWHALPGHGHLFWSVYILGWLGIIFILWDSAHGHWSNFWVLWLTTISLVPASITVDAPHATRSLLLFWCWLLLACIAFNKFTLLKGWRRPVTAAVLGSILVSTWLYGYDYLYHYPQQQSESLKFGVAEVWSQLKPNSNQAIAVVDEGGYDYIVFAWYSQLDPEYFLDTISHQQPNSIGLNYGERVGPFHFIGHQLDRDPATEQILVQWDGLRKEWSVEMYF